MNEAIVTEGLTRRFGELVAVNRLNLSIERGEVFGFLGPNGAGKTTTVRLLNGILNPNEGRAIVLGLDVTGHAVDVRRQTGVLTEMPNLYEALTARENLYLYGDLYDVPKPELPRRVDALLEEFGLGERADERVGAYSKGMKQRLAIARALLHRPVLLFLDEPTAGLDPVAARMVTDMIAKLSRQEGRTVFLCTHNLTEAQRLCDRVGVINRGVLCALGTPRELARQLWHSLRVEIDLHGEPSVSVNEALQDMSCILSRTFEGGKLLLELDDEANLPDVVASIAAAGGRIYGVVPREHTLEEIYFEIAGNAGEAGRGA